MKKQKENQKQPNEILHALIYCRVSSPKQVKEGHGLDSQEQRCINYSKDKNYPIEKVFPDEGVSGGLFERPAMKELLAYLDAHPYKSYVVIFDDLSRFARDVAVHIRLKAEIMARGAKIECLNFNFEDNPESEFAELVLASASQLTRKQNTRQVMQKMRARLLDAFWCFCPPPGLKNEGHPIYKKVLTNVEPYATIYKEAIEGFESNRFNTQDEVRLFILSQYAIHGIKRTLSLNGTKNILTELLYTGYIEYEPWEIPLTKGKHEGFISLDTYKAVQNKLAGRATPKLRNDYNLDFPLRPNVLCNACDQPYTASWNKGRNQKYPNYWCKTDGCIYRYKTIGKSKIEPEFESKLSTIKPGPGVIELAKEIFSEVWDKTKSDDAGINKSKEKRIIEITEEAEGYVIRSGKAKDESVANLFENKLIGLMKEKAELEESLGQIHYTEDEFGTAYNKVFSTLKEPVKMWKSDNIETKRTILYMYFGKKPSYDYEKGFGTDTLSLPIRLMNDHGSSKNQLVEMPGVEPVSRMVFKKRSSKG